MRTAKEIHTSWQEVADRDTVEWASKEVVPEDLADPKVVALFEVIRIEEADSFGLPLFRKMTKLEEGTLPAQVRKAEALLAVLEEVISEPTPLGEYADDRLAHPLIRSLADLVIKIQVASGFFLRLVRKGQRERARRVLDVVSFPSAFARFRAILEMAKITNEEADIRLARGAADYLAFAPAVRNGKKAKLLAYLLIYLMTQDQTDWSVAVQLQGEIRVQKEEKEK